MWPALEPLSHPPPSFGGDHDAPPAPRYDDPDMLEPGDRDDLELAAAAPPDLQLGEAAGEPDDPGHLIESLREQGIFEPPDANIQAPAWTEASQVPRSGTPVGRTLLGVWLVSLLLLGGGYLGWQQ